MKSSEPSTSAANCWVWTSWSTRPRRVSTLSMSSSASSAKRVMRSGASRRQRVALSPPPRGSRPRTGRPRRSARPTRPAGRGSRPVAAARRDVRVADAHDAAASRAPAARSGRRTPSPGVATGLAGRPLRRDREALALVAQQHRRARAEHRGGLAGDRREHLALVAPRRGRRARGASAPAARRSGPPAAWRSRAAATGIAQSSANTCSSRSLPAGSRSLSVRRPRRRCPRARRRRAPARR